jgi:predicted Zn-dependent protease
MRQVNLGILHPPLSKRRIDEEIVREAASLAVSFYDRSFRISNEGFHDVVRELNKRRAYELNYTYHSSSGIYHPSSLAVSLSRYAKENFGQNILLLVTCNSFISHNRRAKGFTNGDNLIIVRYLPYVMYRDPKVRVMARTMAHEFGHLVDLQHCDDGLCLMQEKSGHVTSLLFCDKHELGLEEIRSETRR